MSASEAEIQSVSCSAWGLEDSAMQELVNIHPAPPGEKVLVNHKYPKTGERESSGAQGVPVSLALMLILLMELLSYLIWSLEFTLLPGGDCCRNEHLLDHVLFIFCLLTKRIR